MLLAGYSQDGSNHQADCERAMPMLETENLDNNLSGFVDIGGAECP